MNPAEKILQTLDQHLEGQGHIRLLGGAAMILGYGLNRSTEDADLLMDDHEFEVLVEHANFAKALEMTNNELEPLGLYLTHIWGPEQQILTPEWRQNCRNLELPWATHLSVSVLGPVDLILSKLCRADEGDMQDIQFLIKTQKLDRSTMDQALKSAVVPEVFHAVYADTKTKLLALFA